jgi:hypothetical protein
MLNRKPLFGDRLPNRVCVETSEVGLGVRSVAATGNPAPARFGPGKPAEALTILFTWPSAGPAVGLMRNEGLRLVVAGMELQAGGAASGHVADPVVLFAHGRAAPEAPWHHDDHFSCPP